LRRFAFYPIAVALARPGIIEAKRQQMENFSAETYETRRAKREVTTEAERAAVASDVAKMRRTKAGRATLALCDKIREDARRSWDAWNEQSYTLNRGNPNAEPN
jgi:hypothetical protein